MVILVGSDYILMYATSPVGADSDNEEIKAEVGRFINLANNGMVKTNFEIHLADGGGEIMLKACIPFTDTPPSAKTIDRCLDICTYTFDR